MYDNEIILNFTDDFNNDISCRLGSNYSIKIFKIDGEKAILLFYDNNKNKIDIPEDVKLYIKYDNEYSLIKYYDRNTNSYTLYANDDYKISFNNENIIIENKKLWVITKSLNNNFITF